MINKLLVGHITKCQICSHKNLKLVLELGHQPVVQDYLTAEKLNEPEITYPLNLCRCPACGLLQLDYVVDPKIVFPASYPYRTGLTNMLIRNFYALADLLTKKYKLSSDDLIIDIGSNDGTLLQGFKEKGMLVLGIEPTDAAKIANKNGILTLQKYFDRQVANQVVKKFGLAKIVTATNVFAHIPDPRELMHGIKNLLADDGIFVSESQYLMDIIEKLEFDTIYHEHLRFYSLKPLARLFDLCGCSLADAERISAAGGSIRVYAMKGKRPMSARAKKLIFKEEKAGLYNDLKLRQFANSVIAAKNDLVAMLLKCKKEGKQIVGLGSPARSNTLLGFTKINSHILDYTCEKRGSPKIGLFTPGTHLPVVDEKRLYKDKPEYVLILSWHIGDELMKILRKNGYRGKFIMPLPHPQIMN